MDFARTRFFLTTQQNVGNKYVNNPSHKQSIGRWVVQLPTNCLKPSKSLNRPQTALKTVKEQ